MTVKVLLRRFFLYFMPALLLFYGADKMGNLFGDRNTQFELIAYIIGLVVINVIVPFSAETTKKKIAEQDELIGLLLSGLRDSTNLELERQLKAKFQLNIRIFKPKRSFTHWLARVFCGQRVFFLMDCKSLAKDGLSNLAFKVMHKSKPEGLIGRVFATKGMVHDFDLSNNPPEDMYNLNAAQKEATAMTEFVIAAPIFKGGTQKITAIVSFDSRKKVTLPTSSEWQQTIRDSCKVIHKCIPFICKSK